MHVAGEGGVVRDDVLARCRAEDHPVAEALAADEELSSYTGNVSDSGEGRWTVDAAVETATPAEVLTSALFARFRSRVDHTFGEKILSAMRAGFGGHVEAKKQG